MILNDKNLLTLLQKQIKKSDYVVIQAGHFALIHNVDDLEILIPGIYQDITNNLQKKDVKQNNYMSDFPLETFKIGLSLIKYASNQKINSKLILLINDWQWVKSVSFGIENKYRKMYYINPKIPTSYLKLLKKNNLSEKIVLPLISKENNIICNFFSETKLRNKYDNHYRYIDNKLNCNLNNKCAQEQIPLFNQLSKLGVNLFINFIPSSCKTSIIDATKEFKKSNKKMRIINIFTSGNKTRIKSNLDVVL
jgi:hypothetical protein